VDGHLVADVLALEGEVGAEFRLEVDLLFLDELHDQHGRELLGHGPDSELGVGRVTDVPFPVGQSESLPEDDFPPAATSTDPLNVWASW
jgi:hypothetical protein